MKTLVPTVLGRTAEAEGKKSVSRGPGRQWDEEAFFARLSEGADVARALQAWARETGLARIVFGKGKSVGAMAFHTDALDTWYPLFSIWHPGRIELQFSVWKSRPVLRDEARRHAFRERLNQIPGVEIPFDKIGAFPSLPLAALEDPTARAIFKDAFADLVLALRQASQVNAG
jgi:hypothetical protein